MVMTTIAHIVQKNTVVSFKILKTENFKNLTIFHYNTE